MPRSLSFASIFAPLRQQHFDAPACCRCAPPSSAASRRSSSLWLASAPAFEEQLHDFRVSALARQRERRHARIAQHRRGWHLRRSKAAAALAHRVIGGPVQGRRSILLRRIYIRVFAAMSCPAGLRASPHSLIASAARLHAAGRADAALPNRLADCDASR